MTEFPVNLTTGIPESVLPDIPADQAEALQAALAADDTRSALADVARRYPTFLDAWAYLSEHARDDVEAYAYARVGYHRGLDTARRAGWKGSGYIRWQHPSNQGFLRSLEGLRRAAAAIGEDIEAERCALFLRQLEPDWKDGFLD